MIADRQPAAVVTVFDFGRGQRSSKWMANGVRMNVCHVGAHPSRRFWRRDSLLNMRLSGWVGGAGNPGLKKVQEADVVLDISGGDSFTDIYGSRRFWDVSLPKLIALEQKVPLVLLPQTYGPFRSEKLRRVAQNIVQRAQCAWARDEDSFTSLKNLLGTAFDPNRHRVGVDVAFGLEKRKPRGDLPPDFLVRAEERERPLVGVNVSGLLYHSTDRQAGLGFKLDYRALMVSLTRRLVEEGGARVMLLSHVLAPKGHYESDPQACHDLLKELGSDLHGSLTILPTDLDASETKYVISKLDWLVAARMHATIAALSSGIPAAALAYSPKFHGVFAGCGQGQAVADPTTLTTREAEEVLWRAFVDREEAKGQLAAHLPGIRNTLARQADSILEAPHRISTAQGVS
jgi:polysaccharide pyruvyl transferase WcaK-like protein